MRERRFGRRRVLRGTALAGAGLAGAVLIGCGDDEDEPETPGDGGGGAGGTGSTPEGQGSTSGPQEGGTLSYVTAGDPPNLDMHANSTYMVNHHVNLTYNQLLQNDPMVADETPEDILPDMAESWESSPDGQTYTFKLVQNAKFQNGQAFTSADVKASYERIANPPDGTVSPRQGQFAVIETIDTPDDYTVVLNMNRPVSELSLYPILAQGWMSMYSEEDVLGDFDFEAAVNGTGPYHFVEYIRGNRVAWERNPEYHVEGRPYMDAVRTFIIPDRSTQVANFQSGELLLNDLVEVADIESLENALGDQMTAQSIPGYGFSTINFGQRDPWGDIRVRRAVAMAMDRQAAIALIEQGEGREGGYLSGGGFWSLSEDEVRALPGYEPTTEESRAEARALLDAAGVPEGYETTILTRNVSEELSLYIQDQLAQIGMDATPEVQESAAAYDSLNQRNFDLAPWGHAYAVDDPDAVFAEFYITDAPRNYSEISSQEVDDLFLQQSTTIDLEERLELVKELQKVAVPLYGKIIISWNNRRGVSWNSVNDWVLHSSNYNNQRFENVWLNT